MEKIEDCIYNLDIEKQELINIYVNQWILEWAKKYHPEAFDKAQEFVKDYLNEND